MTVADFLRLVQSVPRWDRTPAILDEELEVLFKQLGEEFIVTKEDPLASGSCEKCVHHYTGVKDVDMCAGDRVEVPRRLCSEVSVCNIFCKIV